MPQHLAGARLVPFQHEQLLTERGTEAKATRCGEIVTAADDAADARVGELVVHELGVDVARCDRDPHQPLPARCLGSVVRHPAPPSPALCRTVYGSAPRTQPVSCLDTEWRGIAGREPRRTDRASPVVATTIPAGRPPRR